MTDHWITPTSVFDGTTLRAGPSVRLRDGTVIEVSDKSKAGLSVKGCLAPGFVDLQVNGAGGVQLNDTPTLEGMRTVAAAHRAFGTVAIMPTIITDRPDVLDRAAEVIVEAAKDKSIIGLHIEGPHIAAARKGTHDARFIRSLDLRTKTILSDLRGHDIPVMITLAPEAVSLADIREVSEMGVVVSLGHTDASADNIDAAIAAGARCGTHLFNAMSPMQGRAPGAVGAILNAGIPFGLICDGHHVDTRMIALALRATPNPDAAFLVSDSMATLGGPDQFTLYGRPVQLQDGRLINSDGGLAGAHITLAQSLKVLVERVGIPLGRALRMAITIPSAVVQQPDLAQLQGRVAQDLVVIDQDLTVGPLSAKLSGPLSSINAAE